MKKTLSNEEIATLCLELSYLYHGGKVSSLDLEEMAKDGDPGGVLTGMAQELDNRSSLAEAMERKNYGEDLIRAIFYGNLARLLQI